jgi:acetyl-CoA synthetase
MKRNEIEGNQVVGSLCIKYPWPGIARTIWVIISYKETYFTAFPGKYFTGDGALRDEGVLQNYRPSVDVVIVSGHNLGTVIEEDINEHPVAESAIVGLTIKGMHYMALLF